MRIAIALLLSLFPLAPLNAAPIDVADREEIIANTARLLAERYVDAALGAQLAAALPAASSEWETISDPEAFAEAVTRWLRARSEDGHLGLSYSEEAMSADIGESSFSEAEMERWYGAHLNHGVQKIERLDGSIMLLELGVFPPHAIAADMFVAAMTLVAEGEALILDLRNNGGGAGTVGIVIGHLAEPGAPLSGVYDRPSDTHTYRYAAEWVPGRRFGSDKPLYILTSDRTFSAAEAVAYDLQALGRAMIVGEVTGGGAHPFEYRRVHEHFTLDLPEARSINPVTGTNWQGIGVQPDVEVPEDQALERALELARAALARDR